MPLSVFTIESVARILVTTKESGTIARETGSPFVQFISREISHATSSLTFSTRNSILETRDSKLSSLEARGTVNLLLSGTVCSKVLHLLIFFHDFSKQLNAPLLFFLTLMVILSNLYLFLIL